MKHPWRNDPKLQGKFHPQALDDLQIIVHDGGPRLAQTTPEAVWVKVVSELGNGVYSGRVLNKPQQLKRVNEGSLVTFVSCSGPYPIMVTELYLAEKAQWHITACNQCGLDELFDAPSELIRVVFPQLKPHEQPEMFTSFCGCCGGVQVVQSTAIVESSKAAIPQTKKWWQFWKR